MDRTELRQLLDGLTILNTSLDNILAGNVVSLPCKVGKTVYAVKPVVTVGGMVKYRIYSGEVLYYTVSKDRILATQAVNEHNGYPIRWNIDEWGETVFATRKEAENVLTEMEE